MEIRMMSNQNHRFDSDELLHLAMHVDSVEQAIDYLKQAIELSQDNGKAYYLLGAYHAQIGLYDRAIQEMTKAVELEPNLFTAHFQLGLLHISSGRVEEAELAWKALDHLDTNDPLFLFKRGLLHLARDEFQACIDDLRRGISMNDLNESLNDDMQNIISQAEQSQSIQDSLPMNNPVEEKAPIDSGQHILLSAYQADLDESGN
jgi:tetratricopeptide (TPR) repeat protein